MSDTLIDIVEDLVKMHGIEGAIDHIWEHMPWPLQTKDMATDMLEKRIMANTQITERKSKCKT